MAGLVLGAESWTQLGHWGRVAVLAVVTTVLLAAGPGDWGLWLGLGLAVGLIVAGSALRRNVPLGIGAAGMVVCSWASSMPQLA
jgi:hypothetical protein